MRGVAAELPDRRMTLKAVVVMNNARSTQREATKNAAGFCQGKAVAVQISARDEFIDELPKTGTGKIDRQA